MTITNLVRDAQLSRGAYDSNNANDTPAINGSTPVAVRSDTGYTPPASFGAQLYKNPDGTYTVAFRGTQGNMDDWAANGAYAVNGWHAEWEAAARFTAAALNQIMAEREVSLEQAKSLLSVTGHSQGGFLAELSARLFGLAGSSLDGMGAVGVFERNKAALVRAAAEEGVEVAHEGYPLDGFKARVYTAIGLTGVHATVDVELSPLFNVSALLLWVGAGLAPSALFQATVHRIDNIVEIEKALGQRLPAADHAGRHRPDARYRSVAPGVESRGNQVEVFDTHGNAERRAFDTVPGQQLRLVAVAVRASRRGLLALHRGAGRTVAGLVA